MKDALESPFIDITVTIKINGSRLSHDWLLYQICTFCVARRESTEFKFGIKINFYGAAE